MESVDFADRSFGGVLPREGLVLECRWGGVYLLLESNGSAEANTRGWRCVLLFGEGDLTESAGAVSWYTDVWLKNHTRDLA